jgi:hypothetical protein
LIGLWCVVRRPGSTRWLVAGMVVMVVAACDRAHRTSPVVLIEIPHPEASLSVVVGGCRW